jgi:hypothetical protein
MTWGKFKNNHIKIDSKKSARDRVKWVFLGLKSVIAFSGSWECHTRQGMVYYFEIGSSKIQERAVIFTLCQALLFFAKGWCG